MESDIEIENVRSKDEQYEIPPLPTFGRAAPFAYNSYQRYDLYPFWKACAAWFCTRGFPLYEFRDGRWWAPSVTASAPFPFATRLQSPSQPSYGISVGARFALARDAADHDLFVKLISKESPEYHINQYLRSVRELYEPDLFPYILPPVAILDSPYDYAFLLTPHWGSSCPPGQFKTVREVVTYVGCLLKALAFLHEHRIAHRDIKENNILINRYCPEMPQPVDFAVAHLGSSNLAFCLLDFDLSLQAPPEVSLEEYRRPSFESWFGTAIYQPDLDVSLAQPEYNPFAFDVGCLGNMLIYHVADAIPIVPALAPLLACMTTHVIEERFSAAAAVRFYEDYLSVLPEELLARPVALSRRYDYLVDPDLWWSLLDSENRQRWQKHRVPSKSMGLRLMLWICRTTVGWKIVTFVRSTLNI